MAAAERFATAPGAVPQRPQDQARSSARGPDGRLRFAAQRLRQRAGDSQGTTAAPAMGRQPVVSPGDREAMIERFREDHANLRSKGFSDEAAQRMAMRGLDGGERPRASLRYRMLSED